MKVASVITRPRVACLTNTSTWSNFTSFDQRGHGDLEGPRLQVPQDLGVVARFAVRGGEAPDHVPRRHAQVQGVGRHNVVLEDDMRLLRRLHASG